VTHCEKCAEGEASVLVVAAIRVTGTMRLLLRTVRCVSCRVVSLGLIDTRRPLCKFRDLNSKNRGCRGKRDPGPDLNQQ